jgi:ATP-dependent RNA helicase DHX8/PRP22
MRPALRAVVTSATLDIERFSSFFGGCPSIVIPGRNFPVDIYHSKTKQIMTAAGPASTSYVKSAVDTALQIHMTQGPGHILVFLTGQEEIDSAVRMIHDGADKLRSSETMQACVLPLYGLLSSAAQSHVFEPVGRHVRKIIVCTNIAETSLTVPGVSFVVDAGYVKQKAYDPRRRMESLVVVPISQSAAQQRSGRAGRTGHGQCYRMYSSECYATMMKEMIPEIRRCSLSNTVLYLKAIGIVDVIGFEYLDPPDEDQLADALLLLYWLGALDRGGIITTRGREMARFPIEPCLARAVLASAKRGCSNEMLTIAAMLSVESLWEHTSKNQKVEAEHAKLRHPHGDTLTYLTIFEEWMASGCSERWARERFLRTRALATAKKIRHQLAQEFFRAGLPVESSCGSDFAKIRRSLCEAYFMNAGQSCAKQSVYRSLPLPGVTGNDLKLMHLHPTCSLLNGNEPPEAVIYIELVSGGRPYMRHVTAVETRWIRRLVDEVSTSTVTISTLCGRSPLTPLPEQKQEPNRVAAQACPAGGSICTEEDRRAQAIVAAKLRFLKRKVPG